jgi:DNA polymerase-3 subunit delta
MIIFLYGEDDYSSRQKLNEIIEKYRAQNKTGLNFERLDFEEKEIKDLNLMAQTSPMFKEKKLLVLENAFSRKAEWQKELVSYLKESKATEAKETTLIFIERRAPDKRVELFKFLAKKPCLCQENKRLEGIKLENWIKKQVEAKGGKIEAEAVRDLAEGVGGDLWQISNEIEKLITYCSGRAIGQKDADKLVKSKADLNIFNTVDALAKKDKKYVLRFMHQHLEQGENEFYLMSMFIRQFRNLLEIKDLMGKGVSYYDLPKRTGLHPFVIKKTYEQTKNFTLEKLNKIYSRLLDLDISIKTGRVDVITALDNLVMFV